MTPEQWAQTRTTVADLMAAQKFTQRKLAQKADVPQAGLSQFLSGKSSSLTVDTIDSLADALGTTRGALLGDGEAGGDTLAGFTAAQLVESKLNSRSDMDPDKLDELAQSIAAHGVQQNILVRAGDKEPYQIIFGARRHKAVQQLVEAGATIAGVPAAAYRIPAKVVDVDDTGHIELMIVENLQREDVKPMDEAESFAWLRDVSKWTTQDIADKIGCTRRHVQKRLSLRETLSKPAKEALRKGEITVAQAQALTVAPKTQQSDALSSVKEGYHGWRTADEIKRSLLRDKVMVGDQAFERDAYTGAMVVDETTGDEYFADRAQFERLTREAAENKVEALRKEWAWAEVHDNHEDGYFSQFAYEKSKSKKKAGAIVEINYDWTIEVHTGLVKGKAGAGAGSAAAGETKRPQFTKAHRDRARRLKTQALQLAVMDNPWAGLRLTVFGLLGAAMVKVDVDRNGNGSDCYPPAVLERSRATYKEFVGKKLETWRGESDPALHWAPYSGGRNGDDGVAFWHRLCEMSDAEVLQLLTDIVASQVGSWFDYQAEFGDDATVVAVAETIEADMKPIAAAQLADESYLKSAGKKHMLEIIGDAGLADAAKTALNRKVSDCTQTVLRGFITEEAEAGMFEGYVPRELRFGTSKELAKQEPKKDPDGTVKASAAAAPKTANGKAKTPAKPKAPTKPEPKPRKANGVRQAAATAAGDDPMPEMPECLRRA